MDHSSTNHFYIVAREPGAEHAAIPTWANHSKNPAQLANSQSGDIRCIQVGSVPGAVQLTNILSGEECQRLIELSESLGFLQDAAVSLPRSVRHNDSLTWVVDSTTVELIWQRCNAAINQELQNFEGKRALGLNARFRFYRYRDGDYFSAHTDGSWPGSAIINGELITNAYDDRWSQMTFLIFLNDNYKGGSTQFYVDANNSSLPASNPELARIINIRTPAGGVLCFPHGLHPLHCLHSSEPIASGSKYIIRSDVLFEL